MIKQWMRAIMNRRGYEIYKLDQNDGAGSALLY